MTLDSYIAVVESLSFQIQFSVLSGIRSLQLAFSRDETVTGLMDQIYQNSGAGRDVYERIRQLLKVAHKVTDRSYDESIACYLFVLKRTEPALALKASHLIWDAGGLLWSCWLAHQIIEFNSQVEESLDFASSASSFQSFVGVNSGIELMAASLSKSSRHIVVARASSLASASPHLVAGSAPCDTYGQSSVALFLRTKAAITPA